MIETITHFMLACKKHQATGEKDGKRPDIFCDQNLGNYRIVFISLIAALKNGRHCEEEHRIGSACGGLNSPATRVLEAAVVHDEPFPVRPTYGINQSPDDYRHFGAHDRYAKLAATRRGRTICSAIVGEVREGAPLKVFRATNPATQTEATLPTDIEDKATLKKLRKQAVDLCGVVF